MKTRQTIFYGVLAVIFALTFAACGDDDDGIDLNTGGGSGVAPTITTTSLPGGIVGTAYSQTLTATGDTPITWSIDTGSLPDGLTLTEGIISGTPITAGTSDFTVKATSAAGNNTKALSIVIAPSGGGVKILVSITAEHTPTTAIYIDTTLDTLMEGLAVTAHYSDSTTALVTGYTLSVNGDAFTAGENTVTVTYTEGGVTKTDTFTLTVDATHVHNWSKISEVSPTCTTAGMEIWECTVVTPSHHEDRPGAAIDPTAHHWGGWTITTAPSNIKEGVETEICSYNSSHTRGTRSVSSLPITTTAEWTNALAAISSGAANQSFSLRISGNIAVTGTTSPSIGYGTGKTVTLRGNGKLYLTSQGCIISVFSNQIFIIDSEDLILEGFSNNNASVIELFGSNSKLELREGTIRGNTNSDMGGGVCLLSGGTFEMSGGYICGNTASNGGGVMVNSGNTFLLSGGHIYNNKTSSNQGKGGGVYIQMGTFRRIRNTTNSYAGTIYAGGDEPGVDNIAYADTYGHAVYYMADYSNVYYCDSTINSSWYTISTDDLSTGGANSLWTKK